MEKAIAGALFAGNMNLKTGQTVIRVVLSVGFCGGI